MNASSEEVARVLMLGRGWFPDTVGGLDRYYRSLLEHLPEASGVVIGPGADAPDRVRLVARPGASGPVRILAYWWAVRERMASADLIDVHFALYAAAPVLASRRRPRVVFHFHGPWADESVTSGDSSRLRFLARHALERSTLRRADAFVVLSGAFRRVLVERYRVKPWDIHVLAPGVALDVFVPGDRAQARARLDLRERAFVVASARRLVPRMGVGVLLDAWEELDGRLPADSMLVVAGDGPLLGALAERAKAPRLAGRVRFLGRISDSELLDLYRAADVAALPTIEHEGFGMVVLEAAACGTPSLVSDVGGLPQAVHGLDSTLVVGTGDTGAWAERLLEAARGTLPPRDATRRFAEGFDWSAIAAQHRALYRRLHTQEKDKRFRIVYLELGGRPPLIRLLAAPSSVNAHVLAALDGPEVAALQIAGISVEVLPEAGFALAHTARLARRLRQLRPDLVVVSANSMGVSGVLAARIARIPLIWYADERYAAGASGARCLLRRWASGVIADSAETLGALHLPAGKLTQVVPDLDEEPSVEHGDAVAGDGREAASTRPGGVIAEAIPRFYERVLGR